MKSVCIIGKGPSVLKCNREWVESFDEVAICNLVPFKGYEHLIGERVDWWFRNWSSACYSKKELQELGLRRAVFIAPKSSKVSGFHQVIPMTIEGEIFECQEWFWEEHHCKPPTGIRALEYFLREKYERIGMVGHDLFRPGAQRYFFDHERRQLGKIGHGGPKVIEYIERSIADNPSIQFEIISDLELAASPNMRVIDQENSSINAENETE